MSDSSAGKIVRARRADVCRTARASQQSGSGSGSCGATLACAWLGHAHNDYSVPSTMLSAVGCACGGHAAAFRASDIASGACAKGCCARQAHAPRPRADASCDNRFTIIFIAIVCGAAPIKNLGQETAPKVGPEMEHRIRPRQSCLGGVARGRAPEATYVCDRKFWRMLMSRVVSFQGVSLVREVKYIQ